MRPNCAKCGNCADMKKFGGPGILKKSCLLRKCTRTPSTPARVNQGLSTRIIFTNKNELLASLTKPSSSVSTQPSPRGEIISLKPHPKSNIFQPDRRIFTKSIKPGLTKPGVTNLLIKPRPNVLPSSLVKVGHVSTPSPGNRYRGTMYPCTVCRKLFSTRIEMIAHRSETHAKVKKSAPVGKTVSPFSSQSSSVSGEPRKSPRTKPEKPEPQLDDEDELFERELRAAITQSQRESSNAHSGEGSMITDLD